jgi:hypothetical protein
VDGVQVTKSQEQVDVTIDALRALRSDVPRLSALVAK